MQAGIAIDKARLFRADQDEIARREFVEAELRESETRYRRALITGRIAAWETDMVTRTRNWTEEGMELFGLDLPDGRGKSAAKQMNSGGAIHQRQAHDGEFHRTADKRNRIPANIGSCIPTAAYGGSRDAGGWWPAGLTGRRSASLTSSSTSPIARRRKSMCRC